MKQETNNDIDILLRKLSKQDRNTLTPGPDGQHGEQEHLDADELNAYAENALPSALRARYTEHLTECASCRKIVTQLSLTSAAVVPRKFEEAKPSAVKTFIAGLFSPFVFRYAIPAMAIVVVVAIAWVAVQRRSPGVDIARNVSIESAPPTPQGDSVSKDPSQVGQFKGSESEPKESRSRAGEKAAASPQSADVKRQEVAAEEQKVAAAVDDLRDREDLSKRNQPQPVAQAPAAGAGAVTVPASPKPAITAERRPEVAQKKEAEADKNKVMNEPQPSATTSSVGSAKSMGVKSSPRRTQSEAEPSSAFRRESAEKDKSDAGEVRTVGDHRFRKQGQVWVDSLYSSQPITNVSRGSEQYRALVADEPGIRSIAEQLKAEFIVVWNGRAYRIK